MSFFQSLFRRFSKKQEIETPENQQNHSEPLGAYTNSKDDAILDDITLDDTNPDDANSNDANLNDDAILDDTNPQADAEPKVDIQSEADAETEVNVEAATEPESVTFLWENRVSKDDAGLSQELNSKSDSNPQVDTTKGDSVPKTNISSTDDTRLSRKSEAELHFIDSLFCDSESSSKDETDNQDIPFRINERYGVNSCYIYHLANIYEYKLSSTISSQCYTTTTSDVSTSYTRHFFNFLLLASEG